MDEHWMEVKLTDKKYVWLHLDRNRITIRFDKRIKEALQKEILGILKMELGDEGIYEKGSSSAERVKRLRSAKDKAQDLKEEIERSILENKKSNGDGQGLTFEEKWKEQFGSWAVDELRTFIKKLESLTEPKIKVTYNKKQKPFFALQIGDHVITVLRPRTYKLTLHNTLRKAEMKDDKGIQTMETFKNQLLDAGMGSVYGKCDNVEIPLTTALERFEELMGYLGELSRELSEAMEL